VRSRCLHDQPAGRRDDRTGSRRAGPRPRWRGGPQNPAERKRDPAHRGRSRTAAQRSREYARRLARRRNRPTGPADGAVQRKRRRSRAPPLAAPVPARGFEQSISANSPVTRRYPTAGTVGPMITLKKEDGAADLAGMTKLSVGVSWDPSAGASGGALGWARRKKGVDLDLIAILMQGAEPVRFAGLDSLDPLGNGAVAHSGDEQTGAASGDDETVQVTFADVPDAIDSIIFVAAAFKKGSSFDKANNISF